MTATRVGIMIDASGTWNQSADEERDEILSDLSREGLEPQIVWYGHEPTWPETAVDLMIVDFGALWQDWNLMDDWTGRVVAWAEEHSGSLVMLWSGMTADAVGNQISKRAYSYGDAMEKWTAWPDNVRALHMGLSNDIDWDEGGGRDGVDWLNGSYDKLRSWFGVENPTIAWNALVSPETSDEEAV